MHPRLVPFVAAWTVAGVLLAACGREGAGVPPAPPAGPARWSAVRGEPGQDSVLIDVKADAPCRVILSVTGEGAEASKVITRLLAAGESARLWWRGVVEPALGGGTSVAVADSAAGRTEGWAAVLHFGWQDTGAASEALIVGTRPGRGHALGPWNALPPIAPAVLPYGEDVQMCAIAVVDGDPRVAFVTGGRGARLQGELDEAAGDRAKVLRSVLRVER